MLGGRKGERASLLGDHNQSQEWPLAMQGIPTLESVISELICDEEPQISQLDGMAEEAQPTPSGFS